MADTMPGIGSWLVTVIYNMFMCPEAALIGTIPDPVIITE